MVPYCLMHMNRSGVVLVWIRMVGWSHRGGQKVFEEYQNKLQLRSVHFGEVCFHALGDNKPNTPHSPIPIADFSVLLVCNRT